MLNHWGAVRIATNKLETFQKFTTANVPHPEWTCDTEVAQTWIDQDFKVYGRKILQGHSGQGIIIFENETITSDKVCPMYTKATKAGTEFRIHVGDGGGTIIDMVQKKKRSGFEGGTPGIRNHSNGWVFARQDISVPELVIEAAKAAVKALNLDFGAVDIGYNHRENKAYVYEVNTAPGIEGTTLQKYVDYFKRKANNQGLLT
jgi:glutathione synthase/RimK-type ligase-like ATP-grasp enzyme